MKFKTLLFTVVLAALFVLFQPRQAGASVTFSYFYESLQPYGDWVDVENYGYCWQPRGLAPDWRPYTDGYWSYTDAGWTWVSYEDFGSITYHYGRWVRLEDAGWVWHPDYEWGPAWVSWRQSDDYIGWAPLPPEANFEPDSGIGVWVDRDYDIGPSAYVFCEHRYFGAPVMRNVLVPFGRNFAIMDSTVNITNITFIMGPDHRRLVFNGGLDYRWISGRTDRRIERLELIRRFDGDWAHHYRPELSRQVGNQLFINAPEIEAPKGRFAPSKVAREIRAPRIDKGWAGLSDPKEKERIQQHYREQTNGLTRQTAPAQRVNAADVQSLVREPRTAQPASTVSAQPQGKAQRSSQPQIAQPQRQAAETASKVQVAPQEKAEGFQQQAEQPQRQAAEAAGKAQRDTQEKAQRFQQQAEQRQQQAAEAAGKAQRDQQEKAQRFQQQAEQLQREASRHERQPEQIQRSAQPQGQQSPTPDDHKKKHKDNDPYQ